MNFWLVKQEPDAFSWDDFLREGLAVWDGVRNYAARNNLQGMKLGDLVLFYHSVTGKCVMGIGRVSREHYPDPTTDDARWVAVEMTPVKPLTQPVSLTDIKAHSGLQDIYLVRQGRLSVMPLPPVAFHILLEMGRTTLE